MPSTQRTPSRVPERIRWAVDQLTLRPADHVLEIGCGPGVAVALVCARLTRGTITAIDRSATQVRRARANNPSCLAAGRAVILHLALDDAPGVLGTFAKVFAINVNAFWTDAARSLANLRRLVRPAGRAFLCYTPPAGARLDAFEERMRQLLPAHGWSLEDVRRATLSTQGSICFIARPVSRARGQ